MKRLSSNVIPPFEFWDYFEKISKEDFEETPLFRRNCTYVYEILVISAC